MTNEPAPAAAPDATDPSMEEILASIRRILDDDDVPATTPDGPSAVPVDDDTLLLDQSMMVSATGPSAPTAPGRVAVPPEAQAPEAQAPEHRTPEHPAPEPPAQALNAAHRTDPIEPPAPLPDLIAPEAAAAAASSVGTLVRTLAAGRATQIYGGGPTLEDMVRAELRPMLKQWLDEYLPPLVERLVRTEIERVVSRQVP